MVESVCHTTTSPEPSLIAATNRAPAPWTNVRDIAKGRLSDLRTALPARSEKHQVQVLLAGLIIDCNGWLATHPAQVSPAQCRPLEEQHDLRQEGQQQQEGGREKWEGQGGWRSRGEEQEARRELRSARVPTYTELSVKMD